MTILSDNTPLSEAPLQDRSLKGVALRILSRDDVRQAIKFCIVGFSSMVVSYTCYALFYYKANLAPSVAQTLAFFISVLNGFYWNSRWTFKAPRTSSVGEQYTKFLVVNIVGWAINTTIFGLIIWAWITWGMGRHVGFETLLGELLHSHAHKHKYPVLVTMAATIGSVPFGFLWNFFINRRWTFKS